MTKANRPLFLCGRSIYLRPFLASDFNAEYVAWLNDPEVNRYSRRRYFPTSEADARSFFDRLASSEHVLAICLAAGNRHIGNIQFGPIDWLSRHAEIRILIGDKSVWGKGCGTEAIYLVTRHLFLELGLHRVEANSCNPAFVRCVEKLNWKIEGRLRERFWCDGAFVDYLLIGILEDEFVRRPEYEAE